VPSLYTVRDHAADQANSKFSGLRAPAIKIIRGASPIGLPDTLTRSRWGARSGYDEALAAARRFFTSLNDPEACTTLIIVKTTSCSMEAGQPPKVTRPIIRFRPHAVAPASYLYQYELIRMLATGGMRPLRSIKKGEGSSG
jgi:hypothetical protein